MDDRGLLADDPPPQQAPILDPDYDNPFYKGKVAKAQLVF
jgi:hypothetical protein